MWTYIRRAECCPGGCGTRHDEWDPDKGGRPDAYRVEIVDCPGCQLLQTANKGIGDTPGRHAVLKPTVKGGEGAES